MTIAKSRHFPPLKKKILIETRIAPLIKKSLLHMQQDAVCISWPIFVGDVYNKVKLEPSNCVPGE